MDFVSKYRWLFGIGIVLLLTLLKVSGSSIAIYNELLPTKIYEENSTIFGIPRWIRSDEYGVQTPKFLSQFYNDFRIFNPSIGISPENMIVDYYSPVIHLAAIGKPFTWGYIFLGNEYGLSFYWNSMIMLLLLCTFELLLIITKGNKMCSLSGALVIAFGPGTQWWLMPHMPIIILYASGIFASVYYYLIESNRIKKTALLAATAIAVIGFTISLFPSFQVPAAYLIALLLLAVIIRDKDAIVFHKKDVICLIIAVIAVISIIIVTYIDCKEAINSLLNSKYPGDRLLTGPLESINAVTFNFSSIYTPFKDVTYANNSEVSSYAHFTVLFLIMAPRLWIMIKKNNPDELALLVVFISFIAFEIIFMCFGVPEIIAKITMFKYCNRIRLIYEWTGVLFSAWGFSLLSKYKNEIKKAELWAYFFIMLVVIIATIGVDEHKYFYDLRIAVFNFEIPELGLYLAIIAVAVTIIFGFLGNVNGIAFIAFIYILISGITINPIEIGTGAIYNHPISTFVSEIAGDEEKNGRFLCTDVLVCMPNFFNANGADVVNATDFYFDHDKWEIIDPENKFENETNRYSNQKSDIIDGDTWVEIVAADQLCIHFNPETIKKLYVRYLIGSKDYSDLLAKYGITCNIIFSQDSMSVYELYY